MFLNEPASFVTVNQKQFLRPIFIKQFPAAVSINFAVTFFAVDLPDSQRGTLVEQHSGDLFRRRLKIIFQACAIRRKVSPEPCLSKTKSTDKLLFEDCEEFLPEFRLH